MNEKKKPIFYYCKVCQKNIGSSKCPVCGHKSEPKYDIPNERDYSKDPSYLDYILKNGKE